MGKLIYKGRVISGSPKVTNTVEKDNMLPVTSNAVAEVSEVKQNREWIQLWKSPNGFNAQSYLNDGSEAVLTMSEDWTKFTELLFVCGYSSYKIPSQPFIIPTEVFMDFYKEAPAEWGYMLGGYGNCYLYVRPYTKTQILKTGGSSGDAGEGLYAIYGR